MTIVRFDANKTLTLGTLKKRAKDVLEYTFVLEKLGLANSGKALGKFTTHVDVKAHARIGEWDVWCNEDDQTIHFLRAGTDTSQDLKYYLVRTPDGFDLIPDPAIAQREQACPVVVGAELPNETLEEAHRRVDLKEYAIKDQAAREALDDEDAQYIHDAMLEDREQIHIGTNFGRKDGVVVLTNPKTGRTVVVSEQSIEHIAPANHGAAEKERIRVDAEKRQQQTRYNERIEKAVTRATPGRKRSVDGRIQQMLGVRGQMIGKKKLAVTNGGDPNCKRCAADPVPCKAHGGARKRKAARELQAIFG